MVEKRGRGRPLGAEINDDRFLNAVADIFVQGNAKNPTAAMRQVLAARNDWTAASPDAMLRRLQVKWSARRTELLAAAEQRLTERKEPAVTLVDVLVAMERLRLAFRAPETLMAFQRISETMERAMAPFRTMQSSQAELQRRLNILYKRAQVPTFPAPRILPIRGN